MPKRSRDDPSQPPPQLELLPPDHGAAHQHRMKNFGHVNPEAFYVAEWSKRNNRRTGRGYLHHLLVTDAQHARGVTGVPYSRRDAFVAAAIIQWLGTNVGHGFVLECERLIDAARARQRRVADRRRAERGTTLDSRTPLQRRKDTLAAARKRLADATKEGA